MDREERLACGIAKCMEEEGQEKANGGMTRIKISELEGQNCL